MASEIVINTNDFETRVALLENRQVLEISVDRIKDRGITGNIYKGRVVRVLPGMQAAFVEIGQERAAFLHASDIVLDMGEYAEMLNGDDLNGDDDFPMITSSGHPIEDLLKEGQEVLVQVTKEPIGTKGARVTAYITLPGRMLVLMPNLVKVGVSRRIQDSGERERLRTVVGDLKPSGVGFIVRTAAEGATEDEIRQDMDFLVRLWETIKKRRPRSRAPSLLSAELDLTLRVLRDLSNIDIEAIYVDSRDELKKLNDFSRKFTPGLRAALTLYEEEELIFEHFGVEMEINRALGKKVWLKSGGYIVIDQTEALTAVDVNTGRFVGKRNLEETIVKTNMEAVQEVVYQLRLRNIGGLIIIDFIDMEKYASRKKVFSALEEALKEDRAKTTILQISELGLVEMTRKRTRDNLASIMTEPCPYCEGKGTIKSLRTIVYDIFRQVRRDAPGLEGKRVIIMVHPKVADLLYEEENEYLEKLEKQVKKKLVVKTDYNMHQEQYQIMGL
ncbi:MAG: Rne/Rng family ribonuclease [bacterium]|nr:Rne/Rng family ribonuclease [bacterium]MDT8395558.1 Rne/Rng family ribonuclease [bacterium]